MIGRTFWRRSSEQLVADINDAIKLYRDHVKVCVSDWCRGAAMRDYLERMQRLGFSEADALRWARPQRRR